jgi:hypothetical protein
MGYAFLPEIFLIQRQTIGVRRPSHGVHTPTVLQFAGGPLQIAAPANSPSLRPSDFPLESQIMQGICESL